MIFVGNAGLGAEWYNSACDSGHATIMFVRANALTGFWAEGFDSGWLAPKHAEHWRRALAKNAWKLGVPGNDKDDLTFPGAKLVSIDGKPLNENHQDLGSIPSASI